MGRKGSDPVKMRPARWTGTPPAGKGWACNILIRKGGGLCPQKEGKNGDAGGWGDRCGAGRSKKAAHLFVRGEKRSAEPAGQSL